MFFNKDLAAGTPDWVPRHKITHKDHDNYYPVINDLATLTWLAQLASLEIHVPQWRFGRNGQPRNPDRLVLDLDPGAGVSLADCAEIARWARDILRDIGHDPVPVTSGSKGIHLYAPLDGSPVTEQATEVARELALSPGGGSSRPGDQHHEALRARREGVHRLEPEQRRQDHRVARTRCAAGIRPDGRRSAHLGRSWRSRDLRQLEYEEVLARVADGATRCAPMATAEARTGPGPAADVPQHAGRRPRRRSRCRAAAAVIGPS